MPPSVPPQVVPFPYVGEIASLAAAMIWAVSLSLYRHYGKNIPSDSLNLFRSLVAVGCSIVAVVLIRPEFPTDWVIWVLLAISGILGLAVGDTALFAALSRLGAQVTAVLQCLSPPLTAIIAVIFIHEQLNLYQWSGTIVTVSAVAGAAYFSQKGESHLSSLTRKVLISGLIFAIVAALGNAIGLVVARHALQQVDVEILPKVVDG